MFKDPHLEKSLYAIENKLLDDYKYVTINSQNVLLTDGLIFCKYQAENKISENISFPVEGQFDLAEEGERLLKMIKDLSVISAEDF